MAQGKSDGTVYIDTKIDTSGIGKGVEETKRKLNAVTESVKRFGDNVKKSFEGTTTRKVGRSYEEVARDIKKAEAQLDKLIEKQIRFVEIGGNRKSQAFAGMEYDIEMARNKLFELQGELSKTSKKAPKSMNVLKKGVESTTKSIKKMGNSVKKSNFSLLKMLGTSILFSFVFRAISSVMQGFVDGLNNFVQYSEEANGTMSSLKSSLTQLKNSFATAFMPIITFVEPALNKLISLIIRINTLIAQFFSALSGKNTYTKAISVQEDYAKSLKGTAEAAEETQKSLSGLDKLNVLSSGKDNGVGGSVSPGEMFEETPIDPKMISLIDKIKKKLKEIAQIFTAGFFDGFGDFQSRIETIKNGVDSIKNSLVEIFTDPKVVQSANKYIKSLVYSFGQIVGSIASIGLTIGENLIGGLALYLERNSETIKDFLISMFDIGTDINVIVGELFKSIAYIFESFAGENGIALTAGLIGIFATTFMGIVELASKFTKDIIALFAQPIIDSKEQIKKSLEDLLAGFSSIVSSIKTIFDDWFGFIIQSYNEIVAPIFNNIKQSFTEFLQNSIVPLASKIGDFLKEFGILLNNLWAKILKPLISWIISNILPIIIPIFKSLIDNFSKTFSVIFGLLNGFTSILTKVIKFINGTFAYNWKKAWNGIKNVFVDIFNSISSKIESFINNAIKFINKLIDGINGLDIPLISKVNIPNISEISMPKLATGAVIPPNAPFAAMLGDQKNGRNLEAPEGLIRQIMREELASIGVNVTFEVEGDPNGIFKVTQKKAREYTKRTGTPAYT